MQLDPAATAAGFRLLAAERLPSTNAHALALARAGEAGPLWITARSKARVAAGAATHGCPRPAICTRRCSSETAAAPQRAPELSFVAALAVHDAIVDCAATLRPKLALKWPNDILCRGAKLAGILVEGEAVATPVGQKELAVAIGIGVNCVYHPSQTSYPATDLAAAGAEVAADALFHALSGTMMRRLAQMAPRRRLLRHPRRLARARDRIGGEMRVRLSGREFLGRCEALDAGGRLLLRLADARYRRSPLAMSFRFLQTLRPSGR